MADYELAIRSTRVLTPEGEHAAVVLVADGRIVEIADHGRHVSSARTVDIGDDALLPGLVDTHVHVNEPGWTEYEGFYTATRAAAAGGVTTILDMPNSSLPPTTTVAGLEVKRQVAAGQCFVDVGFWGGAVADNREHLLPLYQAGVFGFKAYLTPESDTFAYLRPKHLWQVLPALRAVDALTIVHAEDADVIAAAPPPSGTDFSTFLASRPDTAEVVAITRLVEAARTTGARVHVVHLSAATSIPVLRAARNDGVAISVETCPHYLSFAAEEIPDGATHYKCTPPIRSTANRDQLWAALGESLIDCVVSDHAPATMEAKHLATGDFALADPGVSSLQVSLPALWSQARRRGFDLADVMRWMSTEPARLVGLNSKGAIAVGKDADLVWFAPDETWTVDQTTLEHRNKLTAYHGRTLSGAVRCTWLRGQAVDLAGEPRGTLLHGPGFTR